MKSDRWRERMYLDAVMIPAGFTAKVSHGASCDRLDLLRPPSVFGGGDGE